MKKLRYAIFLGVFRHFLCACLYLHTPGRFATHKQDASKQNGRLHAFRMQIGKFLHSINPQNKTKSLMIAFFVFAKSGKYRQIFLFQPEKQPRR